MAITHHPPVRRRPGEGGSPIPFRLNSLSWATVMVGAWLWAWSHLAREWRDNEQYQYGYAVPFLTLYLAWLARPEFKPSPASRWVWAGLLGLWPALILSELLRQSDPLWRLGAWLMMLVTTGLTLLWLWRMGGALLLRRLAFPLFFAWVALPWPSGPELFLTQTLTRSLTALTVLILNWMGAAALQRGNVIELSTGSVGMDTACSGIQSFQASLMAALFLGAFYRMSWQRRLGLMAGGWGIAFVGNLARVLILTKLVHLRGTGAVDQFHDQVGLGVTVFTFGGILVLALRLAPGEEPAAPFKDSLSPATPSSGGIQGAWSLPGRDGLAALLLVGLVPVLAWGWFGWMEKGHATGEAPQLTLQTNQLPAGWWVEPQVIAPREQAQLRYSQAQALGVRGPNGRMAHVFRFHWEKEARMPSTAFIHTPDVCMPSAGWKLQGAAVPMEVKWAAGSLKGHLYRFFQGGQEQRVFHCFTYEGGVNERLFDPMIGQRSSRLSMLWLAPRQKISEELLIYLPGSGSTEGTQETLGELLGILFGEELKVKGEGNRPKAASASALDLNLTLPYHPPYIPLKRLDHFML